MVQDAPPPTLRRIGRKALPALGLIFALAQPLAAQSVQDNLVLQLQTQGYQNITVSRTLLGRLRIVAQQGDMQREVVVNPRTGEVLRDISQGTAPKNSATAPVLAPVLRDSPATPPPALTTPNKDASQRQGRDAPESGGDHGGENRGEGGGESGGGDHGGDHGGGGPRGG